MVCGCQGNQQTQLNQLISIDNRPPLENLITKYQQGRRLSLQPITIQPLSLSQPEILPLGNVSDTMIGTAGGVLIALGILVLIAAMMSKKK